MHEHVVSTSPGVREAFPHLFDREAVLAACVSDLTRARACGVTTIVDVTTVDLGRDPGLVVEASAASGVQVVMSTGVWIDVPRYFAVRDPDHAAEVFVRELQVGIAGHPIRAGIIKVGSDASMTPAQELIIRAAARAARATGAAITTHTRPVARSGLRQLEILDSEGADLSRVVIGHSTIADEAYLAALYSAGCVVGWDQFGTAEVDDEDRVVATLIEFLQSGLAGQTVLSGDYASYLDWDLSLTNGFCYVPEVVLPKLRAAGISDIDLQAMMVRTPARLLAAGPRPLAGRQEPRPRV